MSGVEPGRPVSESIGHRLMAGDGLSSSKEDSPKSPDSSLLDLIKARADVSNAIKSAMKTWFGKGPRFVHVRFLGGLLVAHCEGVLLKHELAMLQSPGRSRYASELHGIHRKHFGRAKTEILPAVERISGQQVLACSYEIYPALDESVFLFRLSQHPIASRGMQDAESPDGSVNVEADNRTGLNEGLSHSPES